MSHRMKRLDEPIPVDETYAIKKDRRKRTKQQRDERNAQRVKIQKVREQQREVARKKRSGSKEKQKNAGIKRMMGYKDEPTWGAGTFLTGEAKRHAEEASVTRCNECGSSAGRHLSICSRAST